MKGYNIAIIGKSGVGKSSLVNYLFGKDIAQTGSGKPVTGRGFHLHRGSVDNNTINLYDSLGLEAEKTIPWLSDFQIFLKDKKDTVDVSKWLHSAVFCLSGENARIESFEKEIIKVLLKEKLNPVIAITKGDAKSAANFAIEVENETGIKPILICSAEKTIKWGKANGASKTKFGKDDLLEKIKESSISSFYERMKVILDFKKREFQKNITINVFNVFKDKLLKESNSFNTINKSALKEVESDIEKAYLRVQKKAERRLGDIFSDALSFYEVQVLVPLYKSSGSFQKDNLNVSKEDLWKLDAHENVLSTFLQGLILPIRGIIFVFDYFFNEALPTIGIGTVINEMKEKILAEHTNDKEIHDYYKEKLVV
ncbi:GTPase [Labilibaculum antarcticum]|uniref:G domain-containing protein n=1 Tax=Labilibaculum antarcticum TaxID=1717717 RepID=A0A1Y1CQU9_9BACT|nr:GTPase domain-containing protein [Labilibaculum antarcticum]BAX82363.1 hypothetical protein ALGA_4072 [Labilibaculum antarcticum]